MPGDAVMHARITAALAVALCIAGCLGPAPVEDDASDLSPIDLPIVGLIDFPYKRSGWYAEQEHGWCGATVVAPRVVLTAKSCLTFVAQPADVRFTSELGTATAVAFHQAGAPAATMSPTWAGWAPADDLAAIVLDADLPVTTEQLRSLRGEPLDPRPAAEGGHLGRTVLFVGHGVGFIAPPGDKHAAMSWIASIADRTLELSPDGELPCIWDRGDPVFAGAEMIGVVSYVMRTPERDRHDRPVYCHTQPITRVDQYRDVIQAALDDAASRAAAP